MTCRELVELLADFVSGELAEEHCRQIQEHLGICPPCIQYVESYRLTIEFTRNLPCSALPADVERRLREQLGRAS
jgi:anti-sigma factor RsiW